MTDDLESLLARGYRYALALSHDPTAAEDLLQDVWLAILQRGAPRHVGYLFRSIRNRFLDLAKRHRLVVLEPLDAVDEFAGTARAPRHLDRVDLERGLSRLRDVEREALYLTAVEGYTVAELAELAELTEQPLGTASSLVRRARHKLQSFAVEAEGRRSG